MFPKVSDTGLTPTPGGQTSCTSGLQAEPRTGSRALRVLPCPALWHGGLVCRLGHLSGAELALQGVHGPVSPATVLCAEGR